MPKNKINKDSFEFLNLKSIERMSNIADDYEKITVDSGHEASSGDSIEKLARMILIESGINISNCEKSTCCHHVNNVMLSLSDKKGANRIFNFTGEVERTEKANGTQSFKIKPDKNDKNYENNKIKNKKNKNELNEMIALQYYN